MVGDFGEVLVLDWGLAKVLDNQAQGSKGTKTQSRKEALAPDDPGCRNQSQIENQDGSDALHTMDGNVIGTPGYMAPEQARGQANRTDERADVYSLGAILYHILKLQPTVEINSTSDRTLTLERIMAGKLEPLHETGRATKPLIAITQKALSLRPNDRYRTVNAFQADLESYMDGFVTTAEELSIARLLKTFMLRHKVASVFSLAILCLLTSGLLINYRERLKAEKAGNAAIEAGRVADSEKNRATQALANLKATAPALLSLVDFNVLRQNIPTAMKIVDQATDLVPESPECHMKRANLLQMQCRFAEATVEYEQVLLLSPSNALASANLDLSRAMLKSPDVQKLSEALWEQDRLAEACHLIRSTLTNQQPRMIERFCMWTLNRERTPFRTIKVDKNICSLDLSDYGLTDLSVLKTLPITHLNLSNCRGIYDFRPLDTLPLKALNVTGTFIADLRFLQGMPLEELILDDCTEVTDLRPLKSLPLTRLELADCINVANLGALNRMPLTRLNLSRRRNPATSQKPENHAKPLDFSTLRHLVRLQDVDLSGCSEITDISFLRHKPLTDLKLDGCTGIRDLSPLKGMPLQHLSISGCVNITDLSPLKGMNLTSFTFTGSGIQDYSFLQTTPQARFLGK